MSDIGYDKSQSGNEAYLRSALQSSRDSEQAMREQRNKALDKIKELEQEVKDLGYELKATLQRFQE